MKTNRINEAMQLLHHIGVSAGHFIGNGDRSKSHTKNGPGRKHKQGDGTHRHLTLKQRQAGSYGRGLRNHFDRRRLANSALAA